MIRHEVLVRHDFKPLPCASRRLAWHPQLEAVLAVTAKDRVFLVNVPPTSGVASSPEFASPSAPSGPSTEGSITAMALCDRGDMLAVSDDKGYVYVWGLGQELLDTWAAGGAALGALPSEPDIKFHAFDKGDSTSALDFLPTKKKLPQQVGSDCHRSPPLAGSSISPLIAISSPGCVSGGGCHLAYPQAVVRGHRVQAPVYLHVDVDQQQRRPLELFQPPDRAACIRGRSPGQHGGQAGLRPARQAGRRRERAVRLPIGLCRHAGE